MEKIKELISKCKCNICIEINDHKTYYESVKQHLDELVDEIDSEIYKEMVKRDTIIRIDFFPNSPNTSVVVLHYDLEKAIEDCLEYFKQKG